MGGPRADSGSVAEVTEPPAWATEVVYDVWSSSESSQWGVPRADSDATAEASKDPVRATDVVLDVWRSSVSSL